VRKAEPLAATTNSVNGHQIHDSRDDGTDRCPGERTGHPGVSYLTEIRFPIGSSPESRNASFGMHEEPPARSFGWVPLPSAAVASKSQLGRTARVGAEIVPGQATDSGWIMNR
jgi:hypothetical protein